MHGLPELRGSGPGGQRFRSLSNLLQYVRLRDQIFWKAYRLHCATEWHKHSRHVCLHADCRGFYSGALVELLVVASQKLQWFRLLETWAVQDWLE